MAAEPRLPWSSRGLRVYEVAMMENKRNTHDEMLQVFSGLMSIGVYKEETESG
jgi:hypothetical protein